MLSTSFQITSNASSVTGDIGDTEPSIRLPQSKAQSRQYALPLPTRPAPIPADQEICSSILDTIWHKTRYRKRQLAPDSFEIFLRELKETTLADIYHILNGKPAQAFQNLFWFAVSRDHNFTSVFRSEELEKLSVSEFFENFRGEAQKDAPDTLRVCCLTETAPDISRLFSYFRLFTLSAYSEPQFWARTLLAYLLRWSQYATPAFADTILQRSRDENNTRGKRALCLPSGVITTMPDWDFKYMWPFDVVEFSAIDIHTRRPYKRQPKMEGIQFYNHSSADGSCSLTLLFDSSRALEKVKTLLTDDSFLRDTAEKCSPVVNPTPLLAIYQVLFTIHHLINEESRQFIENVFSQASDIAFHSRDHPGRAEYLYLLLLQDYTASTIHHTEAARDRLDRLVPDSAPSSFLSRKNSILKDKDYISASLDQLTVHIAQCLQEVKSLNYTTASRLSEINQAKSLEELKQNQIAGIIGFLVAIYVPVAFVSSYFGMNTVEIVDGNLHNSLFWKIAIPLMILTIMLPLSLTIIARVTRALTLAAGAFSFRQWPMLVDISITTFCLSLIIVHIVHWRLSEVNHNFEGFFYRISYRETLVVDTILACFGLLKAIENSVLRNRRGRKWCFLWLTITSVVILCAGLSVVDKSFATLLAPFGFMFITLAVRPLLF